MHVTMRCGSDSTLVASIPKRIVLYDPLVYRSGSLSAEIERRRVVRGSTKVSEQFWSVARSFSLHMLLIVRRFSPQNLVRSKQVSEHHE
jgi:hypothetical protein